MSEGKQGQRRMDIELDNIPEAMKAENRWVVWKYEERDGKSTKVPYQAGGAFGKASSTDSRTWSGFETARRAFENGSYDGVGFVLGGGWLGIDIDKCVVDGEINDVAEMVYTSIPSYCEWSPSLTGLHIICKAKKPGGRSKRADLGVEIYDSGRYFTVTGHKRGPFGKIAECQAEVDKLYRFLFSADEKETHSHQNASASRPSFEDQQVIDKAKQAKNGHKFSALWYGDTSAYGSASEADLALCAIIAFYTQDASQIDRIFRMSALMREKWDARHSADGRTYGEMTIGKALSGNGETYRNNKRTRQTETNETHATDEKDDDTDDIEILIADAQALQGKPRLAKINQICQAISTLSPMEQENYLSLMVSAGLGNLTTLRRQVQFVNRQSHAEEKTAIQLADEFIQERIDKDERLVFHHEAWYRYAGTKYTETPRATLETMIVEKIRAEYALDVSQNLVNSIRLASYPLAFLGESVEMPCFLESKRHTQDFISLQNGLFSLDAYLQGDDPLLPHTSDYFSVSSLPYAYDPDACCPDWVKFLDDSLDDRRLPLVLQEFMGLCLTHDQRFHKFLFLQGQSRTGKGVVFTILQELVGIENVSNVALRDFGQQYGLWPMFGKKLNICAEVPELDKVAEDVLKEYTGGETVINYNRKYLDPIITKQRARLAFSSNNYPNFRDRTEGLWNRMLLIEFNKVASIEDVTLIAKLKEELPGIFNWAMNGYWRLIEQGRFTESFSIEGAISQYKEETIPAHQFVRQHLMFDGDPKQAIHSKTLYKYYSFWSKCEGRATQGAVTFGRDISAFMKSEGVSVGRDKYGSYYPGVYLSEVQKHRIISRAKSMQVLRDDYVLDETEDRKYDKADTERFDTDENPL